MAVELNDIEMPPNTLAKASPRHDGATILTDKVLLLGTGLEALPIRTREGFYCFRLPGVKVSGVPYVRPSGYGSAMCSLRSPRTMC